MRINVGLSRNEVSPYNPLPTTGLTDEQLRAVPVPVSGAFYPVTQPVSGSVNVGNWPGSTPVTGTFWPATQPISGAVSVSNFPATQPVSGSVTASISGSVAVTGSFYQATQPVSGTFWQATQPVSGTFWQTTQPVSIASMPSTPVTGTFFQATQPVSLASMPSTPVTGTFWQATQPVSAPALTKGTQGANGFTTQDLKDAGRAIVNVATAIAGVTAVTSEALLALNVSRDGAATASITSIPVTSNKRFRVTGITVGIISTSAAVLSARFSLRMNPSGAVTASSTIIATLPVSSGAALAQAGNQMSIVFPDGLEFSGTMQIGISQVASAITGTVWASLTGYEY